MRGALLACPRGHALFNAACASLTAEVQKEPAKGAGSSHYASARRTGNHPVEVTAIVPVPEKAAVVEMHDGPSAQIGSLYGSVLGSLQELAPELAPELVPELVAELVAELVLVPELVAELVAELVPVPELVAELVAELVPELAPLRKPGTGSSQTQPEPKQRTICSSWFGSSQISLKLHSPKTILKLQ